MNQKGLKMTEFVKAFDLEVLNQGSDFATGRLSIPDVNRPGLQFHDFYDYFDPRRLQVIGKAEVTYLEGLSEEHRRKCFDDHHHLAFSASPQHSKADRCLFLLAILPVPNARQLSRWGIL